MGLPSVRTFVAGCVKVYLSRVGKFGMVFEPARQAGGLVLAYLAFGLRHQTPDSHAHRLSGSSKAGL
jgi:hypothetical protein